MSQFIGVPAKDIDEVWGLVAPFVVHCIEKSKEHRFNVDDIYQMIADRDLQLWLVLTDDNQIKIVVITQIVHYPRATEGIVFMASGEYPDDWAQITDYLLIWAKSMGCTHMSAYMRRGLLKRMGWDDRQTYSVRALK